ncbi:MAG: ornithine cyclodeaminase family protein, partial [Metallosphaera sp.]
MTIFVKEKDVHKVLTFKDTYDTLREAFLLEESKKAVNTKRVRTSFSGSTLTYQAGALEGYLGFKTYIRGNFISLLFSKDGELLLFAEADRLSLLRTGSLSVLAADVIKKDYSSVGIIGLGKQGLAQVEAFHKLKQGITVLGYTRSTDREAYAKRILSNLDIKLRTVQNMRDLVSQVDVVVTITTATSPFLKLEYLQKNTHVNAMGSNLPERIELYPEVIKAAKTIVVENIEQAKEESGELILAEKMNMLDWNKIVGFAEYVSGKEPVRDGISVFKSVGIG